MPSEPFEHVFCLVPVQEEFLEVLELNWRPKPTGQLNPHNVKEWNEVSKAIGSEVTLPRKVACSPIGLHSNQSHTVL